MQLMMNLMAPQFYRNEQPLQLTESFQKNIQTFMLNVKETEYKMKLCENFNVNSLQAISSSNP